MLWQMSLLCQALGLEHWNIARWHFSLNAASKMSLEKKNISKLSLSLGGQN
jgi:hypothetical protein